MFSSCSSMIVYLVGNATDYFKKKCINSDSVHWLQCESCEGWYHCMCVNIEWEEAKLIKYMCDHCTMLCTCYEAQVFSL